jgi:hypothetical protein
VILSIPLQEMQPMVAHAKGHSVAVWVAPTIRPEVTHQLVLPRSDLLNRKRSPNLKGRRLTGQPQLMRSQQLMIPLRLDSVSVDLKNHPLFS